MIENALHKVSKQLEYMLNKHIAVDRALDLLEASTSRIEEIVAINTLRESYREMETGMTKH